MPWILDKVIMASKLSRIGDPRNELLQRWTSMNARI